MYRTSIILITRNQCEMLKKTIESVLEQITKSWQLVIVDNGSVDGTRKYLFKLQKDWRKNPRSKNSGLLIHNIKMQEPQSEALKKASKFVEGRYVYLAEPGKILEIDEIFNFEQKQERKEVLACLY